MSAEKRNIGGKLTVQVPKFPEIPNCACCGGADSLVPRSLGVDLVGYQGAVRIPYSMCKACSATLWRDLGRWGIGSAVGLLVGAIIAVPCLWLAEHRASVEIGFLGLGIGALVGTGAGWAVRRALARPPRNPRHPKCSHPVYGTASVEGAAGAFGIKLSEGTVFLTLRFTNNDHGRLFGQALIRSGALAPDRIESTGDSAAGPSVPEAKENPEETMLHCVVAVVLEDGRLSPGERRFLDDLCRQWNLPAGALERALSLAAVRGPQIRALTDPASADRLVRAAVDAAKIDGPITPRRRAMIESLAANVEYSLVKLSGLLG